MKIKNEMVIKLARKLFDDLSVFLFDLDWMQDLSQSDRDDFIQSVKDLLAEFDIEIVYFGDEDYE